MIYDTRKEQCRARAVRGRVGGAQSGSWGRGSGRLTGLRPPSASAPAPPTYAERGSIRRLSHDSCRHVDTCRANEKVPEPVWLVWPGAAARRWPVLYILHVCIERHIHARARRAPYTYTYRAQRQSTAERGPLSSQKSGGGRIATQGQGRKTQGRSTGRICILYPLKRDTPKLSRPRSRDAFNEHR